MLGIGKYKANVDTMFYKGEAIFGFYDKNGEYGFTLEAENSPVPIPEIFITEPIEDGNTLIAKASTPALPGRVVDINLTFENNECNGFIKVPFIGKIKIKNATKL